jgi:N-acetyl-gamma-glutamyl-phosphate reductase
MKKAAVLGASGYTGRELQRLLARHPALELHVFASAREGLPAEPPELESEPVVEALDWKRVAECDGVFLCTPHGAAAPLARRCLELGKHVVDLSADFRFPDAASYRAAYAHEHPAPELLAGAVYGLTELARERLHGARLVANPGCYPTSILLPLKPLLAVGLVDRTQTIVCDSKSGVSGAGKTPSARTLFGNSHENFLAYGLGNHRHQPEIRLHAGSEQLVFVPHLLPVFRGILSTIYLAPAPGADAARLRECLRETYSGERFVRVFERGLPELRGVQNTNECHVAVGECGDRIVIVSVIDNLLKGASGQALQNMNLALGLEEAAGLA